MKNLKVSKVATLAKHPSLIISKEQLGKVKGGFIVEEGVGGF